MKVSANINIEMSITDFKKLANEIKQLISEKAARDMLDTDQIAEQFPATTSFVNQFYSELADTQEV